MGVTLSQNGDLFPERLQLILEGRGIPREGKELSGCTGVVSPGTERCPRDTVAMRWWCAVLSGVPPSLAVPPSGSAADHTLVEAFGAQTPAGELNSGARPVPGLRLPEEDDMAYFERRYQERLKMEKMANRRTAPASGAKLPSRTPWQAPK
ncbi:F221A protein, partial [Atractosteus spatula]|nr:F221A protein [Atractosteus spatula]